jgi:hypothetical protein
MRVIGWVVVVVSMLAAPSRADYFSDRNRPPRWTDGRETIVRVYPGTRRSTRCTSGQVERCIAVYGAPTRREQIAAGTERLVWEGKKLLYRGTEQSNVSVGPERLDVVVRDGTITEATQTVQMFEMGLGGQPIDRMCEGYGEVKLDVMNTKEMRQFLLPTHEARDGFDGDYFLIGLVGHGFLSMPTVIVTRTDARDAVVVQYESKGNCGPDDAPFCGDDVRPLQMGVARRVARRYLPSRRSSNATSV